MTPESLSPAESLSLSEASEVIRALAATQSVLLLAQPGIGKSDVVRATAEAAGLRCVSLLGTQIAPEDVSGIPQLVGERTVFCPPRVLLPEDATPFCLFLDELPASAPDVQKAFYSVLLERRIGEFALPAGSWVVAAGNRVEDRALVRTMSSALLNRVFVLDVRADVDEWLAWAQRARLRDDVRGFVRRFPHALTRAPERLGLPFSTPRAWASLADAMDCLERAGRLRARYVRALAFGRLSAEDAARFAADWEDRESLGYGVDDWLADPGLLPLSSVGRTHALDAIREAVEARRLIASSVSIERFLRALSPEERRTLAAGLVEAWEDAAMHDRMVRLLLREVA